MLGTVALGSAPLGSRAGVAAGGTTYADSRAEVLAALATQDATLFSPGAAFLAIAGLSVPVLEGQAAERIDWRGESYRAFAGNRRAMVRADKLAWQVTTGLMTLTEATTLKTAVASAAHVSCVGIGLPGPVVCEVTVGDGAYLNTSSSDGSGLLRSLILTLRQVN